jgi:rubrerythrin
MARILEKLEEYLSGAKISNEVLRDKLSECLAVARDELKLYDRALEIVSDADVSRRFREFREQTRKSENIIFRIVKKLGMNPDYQSPEAKLAHEKAMALLDTMLEGESLSRAAGELNAIENIVLAQTKDHADWKMLEMIARHTDDSRLREILKPAVAEVEPEELEHLNWTRQQMSRLEFAAVAPKASTSVKTGSIPRDQLSASTTQVGA